MKISKQEEYGLRCILQLARAGHGKSVAVTEISKKEGLSTDYVTKLLVTKPVRRSVTRSLVT